MGVVYKAKQLRPARVVALKMIRDGGLASADEVSRFRAEAEAVARLQHANIVQIYEVGDYRGLPFFSLEFCTGGTLADHLNGQPQPPRGAAQMLLILAKAIHAAHEKGIIHRDLKPQNVLLASGGCQPQESSSSLQTRGADAHPLTDVVLKITDFGLAKRLDANSGHTPSGAVMGTPSYMAPEQALGHIKSIGPAADVYSLGAILYEMLTGRPPFLGQTALDTIQQVLNQDPVPVRQLQPKCPRDLETVCHKCLSKDPARRYVSARDLAEDLGRFLTDEPVKARPVGASARLVRWARKRPAAAALAVVSLAALVAVSVGVAALIYSSQLVSTNNSLIAAEAEAQLQRQAAIKAQAEAERERTRSERLSYFADMGLAQWAKRETRFERMRELIDSHQPGRHSQKDLPGFEWYYLSRFTRQMKGAMQGHSQPISTVIFSPDGRQVASASADNTVIVWDLKTKQPRHVFKDLKSPVNVLAFSPDGKRLAGASFGSPLLVWDIATGKRVVEVTELQAPTMGLAFSPDGKTVVTADTLRIVLRDATTGKTMRAVTEQGQGAMSITFRPDGKHLAGVTAESKLKIWEVETGKELHSLPGQYAGGSSAASYSPNGKRLAVGCPDQHSRIFDAETGKELRAIKDDLPVRQAVFSRDGTRLATISFGSDIRVWDAEKAGAPVVLKGHQGLLNSIDFGPDGLLVSGGSDLTIRLWNPVHNAETMVLNGHTSLVTDGTFSPNGQLVASAARDGTVRLWNAVTGETIRELTAGTEELTGVAFSPDGRWVACTSMKDTVRVWNVEDGREVCQFPGDGVALAHVVFTLGGKPLAFSPDGKRLAALVSGGVTVWNMATRKVSFQIPATLESPVMGMCWHPSGTRLATSNLHRVTIWDVDGPRQIRTIEKGAADISFSPDGRRLATTFGVWDAETGDQPLCELRGHEGLVQRIVWSADGRRLATACRDMSVKIWDPVTGGEALMLNEPGWAVGAVSFSPDGRRLLTASSDTALRIWEAPAQ
jgi:WD40 repeat protein/tRNA A-37 threonylcarbamoyl transferase component Bud32